MSITCNACGRERDRGSEYCEYHSKIRKNLIKKIKESNNWRFDQKHRISIDNYSVTGLTELLKTVERYDKYNKGK